MEQAAKNVDNFKVVLKNVDDFGKKFVRQGDNYGKQFTTFGHDLVDESVLGLSKAAQEGLERAKAFSLNLPTIGVVEDAMTGQRMMMADVVETTVGGTAIGSKLITPAEQFKWLDEQIGGSRLGMTWHHTEIPGRMELVPFGIHNLTLHNGGRTFGMWA